MAKPNQLKQFKEIDLKLGIKSSLPEVKSTLALAIIFAESVELKTDILYSQASGTGIMISDSVKDEVLKKISNVLQLNNLTDDDFLNSIAGNYLFSGQLEALIVAFELIWKYSKIAFVDARPASAERTDGARFEKKLSLTTNADLLHHVISADIESYLSVLLNWIGLSTATNPSHEQILISTLSVFSEEAIYKLQDNSNELLFNMEGIYEQLVEGNSIVNVKSETEPKGSLRILNSFLKESLNPFLDYSKWDVSEKNGVSDELKEYHKRVENYLSLTTKKVDIVFVDREPNNEVFSEINYDTTLDSSYQHNRIMFGAPGTGKSFNLNRDRKELLAVGGEFARVTFHPDYSYAQFVGSYKPTMIDVDDSNLGDEDRDTIAVLEDKNLSAQEKYDALYEKFKQHGLTRLPVLLGLYEEGSFNTKKADGTPTTDNNSVERNHGRAIRPYVNLLSDNSNRPSEITYEYIPGPFMRMYVKALKNAQTDNPIPHLLIIEEINRANVAAVFGDVFQLLDRDENNVSEYAIVASEDIKKYLSKELGGKPNNFNEIKLPNNMFIWATMNSADQGVFPMDTAFKRRWNFVNVGIDDGKDKIEDIKVILGSGDLKHVVKWNDLREEVNNTLASDKFKLNEDKLLGPFFVAMKDLATDEDGFVVDNDRFLDIFKSKVIMYLFEDAVKQKRKDLFTGAKIPNRYSSVCKAFDEKGIEVFCSEILDKVNKEYLSALQSTVEEASDGDDQ